MLFPEKRLKIEKWGRLEKTNKRTDIKLFSETNLQEALSHIQEEIYWAPGGPRYICCLLGAIYEEIQDDRPDLRPILLEAIWMAMRMSQKLVEKNCPMV